jgi:hypothetical protein
LQTGYQADPISWEILQMLQDGTCYSTWISLENVSNKIKYCTIAEVFPPTPSSTSPSCAAVTLPYPWVRPFWSS